MKSIDELIKLRRGYLRAGDTHMVLRIESKIKRELAKLGLTSVNQL